LEGILNECDNDVIKALKRLYAEKTQAPKNPYFTNNQENRFSQANDSSMNMNRTGRRKYNEISNDTQMSNKADENDSDEEEKHSQTSSQEDLICDNYTTYLINQLKGTQNEEAAYNMIKK
jgi:hypothetical protein